MVRSITYSPDGIVRASFCKQPVAGTQHVLSHGLILGELGVGANEHKILTLVFPHGVITVLHLASVLFVQLWVGYTHYFLERGWSPKRHFFSAAKTCSTHK